MPDTSSKGLIKPFDYENYDVTVVNANNQRINDFAMGAYLCTSTTRPTGSNRWTGVQIYEEDTDRLLTWDSDANGVGEWVPVAKSGLITFTRTAGQSLTAATWVTVSWNASPAALVADFERRQSSEVDWMSIASGVITFNRPGIYEVQCAVAISGVGAGESGVLRLYKGTNPVGGATATAASLLLAEDRRSGAAGVTPMTLAVNRKFGANVNDKMLLSVYATPSGAGIIAGSDYTSQTFLNLEKVA